MPKLNIATKSTLYNTQSKYMIGKEYFENLYKEGLLPDCNRGFVSGNCNCKSYAKNILCGKEYCKDCGKEGSPQHQKRFNRWLPKAKALNKFGVLVVTIPEQLRGKYQSKIKLSQFRTALKNKIKTLGFKRGLMRWHLFGDCIYCNGKSCYKCNHTGAGNVYKPHLNIVIDNGFIKDIHNSKVLTELKKFITNFWKKQFNQTFENVINYHYSKKLTDRLHQIKYITRSTFRIYDQEIDERLKNYRLTTVWGTWNDKVITPEEAEDNNCCLDCKSNIRWIGYTKLNGINSIKYLKNGKFKIIATDIKNQALEKSIRLRPETVIRLPSPHQASYSRPARP